jgi:serine/threonine-protein kinase
MALEAIAQAHAQGIIHRDLKPSNLFLAYVPDGSQIIKVLDFGISKPTFGRVSELTSSRSVLGSPPYMSPEQVRRPRSVDTRTDIWSVGILLYELLTGKMPFDGEEVGELFAAILEQEPRTIRSERPDVSEGLERVIMRCLSKNREKRFPDVGELARALAPYGTGSQSKSIEKITSTLLRGEELSSPRRMAVMLESKTVPDDPPEMTDAPAPELSPTASTVGRKRTLFTLIPGTTKTRIAAFAGGSLAALAVIVIIIVVGRGSARSTAAAPPPVDSALAPGGDSRLDTVVTAPMTTAPTPAVVPPTAQAAPTKLSAPRRAPIYRAPPRPPPPAATPNTPPTPTKPTPTPSDDDELKKAFRVFPAAN